MPRIPRLAGLQAALARWPRPTIGPRGHSSYVVLGLAGYAAGLALVSALVAHAGLGPVLWLVLAVVPPATLLGSIGLASAGLISKRIVFYEKALLALGFMALVLAVIGQPLAPGLDLATLGLGTFLAVGRVGCLRVGCCHGRPARAGVRYGWDHIATGFPERWVGRAIFPIQLLDGAASAIAVTLGTAIQLAPHLAGQPLAAYACVYGAARFALELSRGDGARQYRAGVSEPQWSAVATVACAAAYRPAPLTLFTAAALAVAAAALVVARRTGRWPCLWLASARHLAEVDDVLERLVLNGPAITTSEGLRMSLGALPGGALDLRLEHGERTLTPRCVRSIARQLGRRWTVLRVDSRSPEHHVSLVVGVAPESLVRRA